MKKIRFLLPLVLCMGFSACANSTVNKEIELTGEVEAELTYELVPVERMSITDDISVTVSYTVTTYKDYCYDVENPKIDRVYVKRGDVVKKGDVLCEIENDNLADEIANLEYSLEYQKLELQHIIENRDFEIETEEVMFTYGYMTDDDKKSRDDNIAAITERYATSIEAKEDEIYITGLRLDDARAQYEAARLVADFDGVVSFCKTNMEGSVVGRGENIIRIYDNSDCLFVGDKPEFAQYFEEGKEYTASVGYGKLNRSYTVVPAKMDEWGDNQYFKVTSDNENNLGISDHGTITMTVGQHEDSLVIPTNAVHKSLEKYYVYILDEEGIRRMKYITVGITGKEYTEVIDGLSEGDYVILK